MTPGIWTAIYVDLPLHAAFRALHAVGWRAFEISTEHLEAIDADPDPERPLDDARQCLAELGLAAPQAHAHLKADVAAADPARREHDIACLLRHTLLADRLGVRNVVMHPGGREDLTTRAGRARTRRLNVEAYRRLGDAAGERRMQIGIENLMRSGLAAPPDLLDLIEAIDHPAVGFTIDTSHANASKQNVPDLVRELGPRLVATHISDNDGSGDQHRLPGSGAIDWPAVMTAFAEIGYTGLFNLEIPGERHPNPELLALRLRHAHAVTAWLVGLAAPVTSS